MTERYIEFIEMRQGRSYDRWEFHFTDKRLSCYEDFAIYIGKREDEPLFVARLTIFNEKGNLYSTDDHPLFGDVFDIFGVCYLLQILFEDHEEIMTEIAKRIHSIENLEQDDD